MEPTDLPVNDAAAALVPAAAVHTSRAVGHGLAAHKDAATHAPKFTGVPAVAGRVKWRAIRMHRTLSFEGGFQTKALPVETFELDNANGVPQDFVHVSKNREWLVKMAGGNLNRAGAIFDTLRNALKQSEPSEPDSAVADGLGDEDDPMNKMDDVSEIVTPKRKRGQPPKRTPNKSLRRKAMTVTMPMYSPTRYPGNAEDYSVTCVATNRTGKPKLWIAVDDIPWLVTYLADELGTGGVTVDSAVAEASPNCKTPGLSIRMKPEGGTLTIYEAHFVSGPLAGKRVVTDVKKFTQEKWEQCTQWSTQTPSVADAATSDVQAAAIHYLEMHMARLLLKALGRDPTDAGVDPITAAINASNIA